MNNNYQISQYRQMKILLFYDLPSITKNHHRIYSKFHTSLIKLGFIQIQESIYIKHVYHHIQMQKEIIKLKDILPTEGDIRILPITNKQYERDMIILRGNKSIQEFYLNDNDLEVI